MNKEKISKEISKILAEKNWKNSLQDKLDTIRKLKELKIKHLEEEKKKGTGLKARSKILTDVLFKNRLYSKFIRTKETITLIWDRWHIKTEKNKDDLKESLGTPSLERIYKRGTYGYIIDGFLSINFKNIKIAIKNRYKHWDTFFDAKDKKAQEKIEDFLDSEDKNYEPNIKEISGRLNTELKILKMQGLKFKDLKPRVIKFLNRKIQIIFKTIQVAKEKPKNKRLIEEFLELK